MPDEPSLNKALRETGEARAEGMKDSENRTLWSWVGKWAELEYRLRCGEPRAERSRTSMERNRIMLVCH